MYSASPETPAIDYYPMVVIDPARLEVTFQNPVAENQDSIIPFGCGDLSIRTNINYVPRAGQEDRGTLKNRQTPQGSLVTTPPPRPGAASDQRTETTSTTDWDKD